MSRLILLTLVLAACTVRDNEKSRVFPVVDISDDDEWTNYEGRWQTSTGVIELELSLKSGSFGQDSYYKLIETFVADSLATGNVSEGLYSTADGFPDKALGLSLHALSPIGEETFLRYRKSNRLDEGEEMYFITRGTNELLPCDDKFIPLTMDKRYTLHKRSKRFTVEGYVTIYQDTATFFERNTGQNWTITCLGEFSILSSAYKKFAKDKYEGIYLRALAYAVENTDSVDERDALVIKRILCFGDDADFNLKSNK